jgi:hypothetical protein
MQGYNYELIGTRRDRVRKFNGTTINGYNKYTAAGSSSRRGGKVKYWQWANKYSTYRRQNYVSSVLKPNS